MFGEGAALEDDDVFVEAQPAVTAANAIVRERCLTGGIGNRE